MNNITYAVSVDVNNPIIPYNVYVASVLDSNVRYLEITLYQNGNVITLSNEATATASLVTDNVLVDDSVECTISNNIISVPLEDLQRHGNLDVQVTVTEGTKVLAIPFPIQVRVTPNIAEDAQIDENSMGSYAEVVQEIAEARNGYDSLDERLNSGASGMEAVINKVQSINSQSQTGDNNKYPSVTAVRNYVNTKTDDLQDYIENELDELDEAKAGKTDTNAQFERLIAVLQNKAGKAETLAGYGINDAYTKAEVDALENNKEDKINKVQSINSQSQTGDNDKYPSVAAVRNYVNTKTDDLQDYIESAFNTFEIECYDRVESSGQERQNIDLSFTAGIYPKATGDTVTLETNLTDIKYAVTSVVPGETIHVHCQNNWMARAYLFADSSGKGLSWFPENSISPTLYDTDVVVPENAATMYIMGKFNTDVYAYRFIQVPVVTTFTLDVEELMEKIAAPQGNNLTVNISNDTLSVSNGVKTVVAGLHASTNGGFSFSNIYGKNASDDVCPIKINGSYVGGNHGFTAKIVVNNSNGHGKIIADIGSVYERSDIPGREYVIVSVPSTTQLCLIRRDGSMEFINSGLSFTFTHVSGGTNTDPISFTSLSSYQQLQPGINNIDLDIFADVNRITSGETECKRLKIVESYNIISLAEIANYLISNVGQNDNSSYYDDAIAGIAKRTTVYEIIGDMSITVSDYLQSLGAYTLSSMGVVQSQMLGTKYLAPYTTYSGVQDITSNVTINKQVWSNVDVPPHKIYQLDTTSDIKGQLMLYPPFGLGETDQRVDALGANGIACTIDGSTKKFYPIFYGKNIEIATGTLIGGYAIRAPFEFDENGVFSFVYQIAGKTYAEIECLESGDYYASVGTEHSVIRNMMAKQNIVLNTETIIDGKVYFHCTGNGSITLEIA